MGVSSIKFIQMMKLDCHRPIFRQGQLWSLRLWDGKTEKVHVSGAVLLSDMEMHLNSTPNEVLDVKII